MDIISDAVVTLDTISLSDTGHPGIRLRMLRLDKLHAVISGNKWYKLRYNLEAAVQSGFQQIITFGGAYSNHLVAAAAAASFHGLTAVGVIRGLHAAQILTPTLKTCREYGMQLHFVSREAYDLKNDAGYLHGLLQQFGPSYIIPEGGDNEAGRLGAGSITALIPDDVTHVCLPVGSGTTFTGIRKTLPAAVNMIGFTAMKGGSYLTESVRSHLLPAADRNWHLEERFHFGGFARKTDSLIQFMQSFYIDTAIPLDIVYTGKMMAGIHVLLDEHYFPENASICCIHTGGLQGNPEGLFPI